MEPPDPKQLEFSVSDEDTGRRLDAVMADLAEVPRAQVQRWIESDRVTLNGQPCRASRRVALGDRLVARPPEPIAAEVSAEELPLDIVYEDSDLVVVDKSPDMVVHPAPGHASGTLVNALLHHCGDLAGIGGVLRPGIVHRLDRGTSGILVVAKNDEAHVALAAQFHDHTIDRVYEAFVRAVPRAASGRVDQPIGRHPRDRKRMSVREGGREAHTAWRVVRRFPASGVAHVEIRPETGRTHQIRVHLSSAGMPIVGDQVYGRASARMRLPALPQRAALHARALGFRHPRSGERVRFEAPFPPDLEAFERALESREERT